MKFGVALLFVVPALAPAQQIAMAHYPTASPMGVISLNGITSGPDGALWFSDSPYIGRITTAGALTSYLTPASAAVPLAIVTGPDGALWFTAQVGNAIGRLTTAGVFSVYPIPSPYCLPNDMAPGPDGALWFTESNANKIGRVTTAGVITEYAIPTPDSYPWGIAAGSDGALWFAQGNTYQIGRIATDGSITEYPVPAGYCPPEGITGGPDGALWFTDGCNDVGRITTSGVVTEYPVTVNSRPFSIATGPDGALWFTESNWGTIGRITTDGAITAYPVPAPGDALNSSITTGPDGEIWFSEPNTGPGGNTSLVGEALFVAADLSVSPPSGYFGSNLMFAGSGFGPNESVKICVSGVGSAVLASAVADSGGSFTASARATQSEYGPRVFVGAGQQSGKLAAANFSVGTRMILDPDSGPPGTTVTVTGYGFNALEKINVIWAASRTVAGKTSSDIHGTIDGSAAVTFTVPLEAAPGANVVVGRDVYGNELGVAGRATFIVQ